MGQGIDFSQFLPRDVCALAPAARSPELGDSALARGAGGARGVGGIQRATAQTPDQAPAPTIYPGLPQPGPHRRRLAHPDRNSVNSAP